MSMDDVLSEAVAAERASLARDEGTTSIAVEPPPEAVAASEQPESAEVVIDDTAGDSKGEAATATAAKTDAGAAAVADAVPFETVVKHIFEVVFPNPLSVNLEEAFRKKKGKRKADAGPTNGGPDEELEDQQATQKPRQPDRQLQQKESTRQRGVPESQSASL